MKPQYSEKEMQQIEKDRSAAIRPGMPASDLCWCNGHMHIVKQGYYCRLRPNTPQKPL